jgi:hypothetical protein
VAEPVSVVEPVAVPVVVVAPVVVEVPETLEPVGVLEVPVEAKVSVDLISAVWLSDPEEDTEMSPPHAESKETVHSNAETCAHVERRRARFISPFPNCIPCRDGVHRRGPACAISKRAKAIDRNVSEIADVSADVGAPLWSDGAAEGRQADRQADQQTIRCWGQGAP